MTEFRLIAGIASLVAILGFTAFGMRYIYNKGHTSGVAEITAQWDADKLAIQKVTDAAIAQATAERDMALKANEGIENDYQAQLSASHALSDSLAIQLRKYAASHPANSGTVPKTGSGQAASAASSPAGDDRLTSALGAALAECSANTAQLDALIIELKPQL